MNEHELQALVEAAVKAVLQQLPRDPPKPAGPRIRVLVTDTDQGLDLALASLHNAGISGVFEPVLTSGERSQVTSAFVRQALGVERVLVEPEAGCPLTLARDSDALVAATLDRPTAVRVALTMPETFASKLLFEALRRGKPVVLATDGLRLEAPQATAQLRQALAEPVGRLEVFGATCVEAVELGAVLRQELAAPGGFNAAANRVLITAEEVEAASGEVLLPPGAIVTPLALDRARELGVKLSRIPH